MINSSKERKLRGEWKKLSPSVYESKHGDRIHTGGLVTMASGHKIRCHNFYVDLVMDELEVMGGNKKRALMLFAETARPVEIAFLSARSFQS